MNVLEDAGVGTAAKDSAVGSPGGFGDVEICGYLMILYHHS